MMTTTRIFFSALVASAVLACGGPTEQPKPQTKQADEPAKAEDDAQEPAKAAADQKQPAEAPAPAADGPLPDRDPALARALVREQGALLIDVRTKKEFDEGHVEGAINIPHTEVPGRTAEILELAGADQKSKPIVVYCRSGRRSGIAKQSLTDAGFTKVTNLGGFTDWCEDCK